MIKSTVGKNLDVWIRRLFPFLFWWELDPNALTVAGALVSTAAGVALAALPDVSAKATTLGAESAEDESSPASDETSTPGA